MKKIILYVLIVGMFIMSYGQVLGIEGVSYYVYSLNEAEEEIMVKESVILDENHIKSDEKALEYTFQKLFAFTGEDTCFTFIPEKTKLIGLQLVDGHLTLNVSKDIQQYGGSHWEYLLENQILATTFGFEKVDTITLLIDGEKTYLPEGTMLDNYSRKQWKERMSTYNGTNRSEDG